MDSENKPHSDDTPAVPSPQPQAPDYQPTPGYQPTTGRKLFMFLLCLIALIAVWATYWFAGK